MKDFFKKISIGGYIAAAGAVIALAALIVGLVSCSPSGFFASQMVLVILFTVLGIVAVCAAIFLAAKLGDNFITTVLLVGAVVLLMFALFRMVDAKEDVLGTVLFSDLEKGFAPAEFACYVGVASMVIFAVSIVTLILGNFFNMVKKETPAQE